MSGFFQNLLNGAAGTFFGSDYLRDYTHASKTFRTNGYQYAPKLKFLFHVYFDINTQVYEQNVGTGANFGLAVKTVKLPGFTFATHDMNQYNRKRIVQTKIKYDPVDINFHDDNGTGIGTPNTGGIVRNMWKAYYAYYYNDGSKPRINLSGTSDAADNRNTAGGGNFTNPKDPAYNTRTAYSPSITGNDDWGYIGEPSGSANYQSTKLAFFKNITIFGFNQHNFVQYTLVNPIITRFAHDTYSYAEGNGTMEHSMTIDYETVVYDEGAMAGNSPSSKVPGFGLAANYDRTVSPIARAGANNTIMGQGGLVDGASGAMNQFAKGNYLAAFQAAGTTYNTFKNTNLKKLAKQELVSGITNSVQQTPNRNLNVSTPIFGATPTTTGTAGVSSGVAAPKDIGTNPNAGSVKQ